MKISKKYMLICVLAAVSLFAGVSLALATDNNTIYACVKIEEGEVGELEWIATEPFEEECQDDKEKLLSWGIVGPQGEPGYLDIYTRESPFTSFGPGVYKARNLTCWPGDEVLSGGYEIRDDPEPFYSDQLFKCIDLNWSKPDGDNGWRVQVFNNCEEGTAYLKVYVRCADTTP
jgi:hypothetical protein